MCVCPIAAGSRVAHCAGYHHTFTSPSGFDAHQRADSDSGTTHRHPADVGLVARYRSGRVVWSYPPDPRYTAS